jgi:hypothetical protein
MVRQGAGHGRLARTGQPVDEDGEDIGHAVCGTYRE